MSEKASAPPVSTASAWPLRTSSPAYPIALALAAHAVSTDSTGPRRPKAPLSASAIACGGTSSTSRGSGCSPRLRRTCHSSPASSPALQVPITTPQRSAGIVPTSTPQLAIASSAALSVKSIARSWNPSGFR